MPPVALLRERGFHHDIIERIIDSHPAPDRVHAIIFLWHGNKQTHIGLGGITLRARTLLVFPLFLLGACSSTLSSEEALRHHGYSEAYVQGYHDGCPSGRKEAGELFVDERRDSRAYAEGGDYKSGWDYGFVSCMEAKANELKWAGIIGSAVANGSVNSHGSDGIDTKKMLKGVDTSSIKAAGW